MKIRKILAGMSAAAIAATMLAALPASAAETYNGKANAGTMKTIKLDSKENNGLTKLVQIPLDSIWPEDTTATITNVTMTLSATDAPAAGWIGGGGSLGFDVAPGQGNTTDDLHWMQVDTAKVGSNDDRPDDGEGNKQGALTLAHCTWEESWDFTYTENADFSEGDKLIQFGWWWGAGDTVDITDWKVTFSDGTVVTIVSEDGIYDTVEDYTKGVEDAIAKAARENAAAEALAKLEEAVDAADFEDVINSMNDAAKALNNAADVIAQADAAKKEIEELQAVLDEATEAFEALQDGDVADTAAYQAAKEKVDAAAAELAAAQKAFENAQKAYDAKTQEALAAKDKEIADLEDEVDDLKAQLAAAPTAEEKAALEAQIAEKEAKIAELEKSVADLEKALKDAKKAAPTTDDSKTDSKPDTKTDDSKTDDKGSNPNTGTGALATVGLALAAAAFVVSKKRK